MEEVKKVELKKSKKWLFIPLGILVIFLFCCVVIVGVGFLASKYIPEVEEYISKYINFEESEESKQIVLSGDEVNIINIVENTGPSVVSIAISKLSLTQEEGLIDESNNIGTGFVVSAEGVIITNQHVVSDTASEYKVVTKDGDEFAVVEILRDDVNDLALLKIDPNGKELKAIELGDSDDLLVGQTVIAIGTPLGEYAGSVTSGIISGLNRSVTTSASWFGTTSKTYEGVIQTDAAVNPGNSGGPLINSQGKVIGINFATTSGADNISFAIPINKIKSRIEEYRTYGKFIKPYFGVTYQMISEYEALYYSDVVAGALVVRIDPLAPAYKAGIRRGDIITEFAGEKLSVSLGELIQRHKVGEEIEVKVYRSAEEKSFKVTLAEMD